ncbi:MAG: undecaprenyl-phosphate glucose phosphotransferase [Alphaproteobacteria bacterium]|nr:MAG: undecaprenyl-phosphate glucose phosphotransferase [Alphaproteobacteria bacterium]
MITKTRKSSDTAQVFSAEALREAMAGDPAGQRRTVELNELAKQVAELFSTDAVSPQLIVGLTRLIEFAGLVAIGLGAYWLYGDGDQLALYGPATLLGAVLTFCLVQAIDGYDISSLKHFAIQFTKAATGFTLAMVLLVVIGFFSKIAIEYSRLWFANWYVLGIGFILLMRTAVWLYVRRAVSDGRLERRAVIVGGGAPAAELIRSLEAQKDSDIRICGIFDDRGRERSPAIVAGYPKLGTVPELVEFGRKARVDMLIVTLPMSAEKRVLQLLKRLWVLPVDIRLSAHANKLRFRPRSYTYEGSVPFLDLFEKPIADWDALSKRAFDILFSAIALVALSPLMLATAIAIRLESKGPVIFRQKRYGFNNEVIEVLKFRSMYHEMADPLARKVVTRDDPRVTRVGRFIRRTSIDELPQLFNVLKGNLSLVGPRPHAVNAHTQNRLWDDVVDGYFARHRVKPGVTGWAQINGWRGEVDSEDKIRERVNCDLYYIENWSLLFDLYIVLMTPIRLLNTEHAY